MTANPRAIRNKLDWLNQELCDCRASENRLRKKVKKLERETAPLKLAFDALAELAGHPFEVTDKTGLFVKQHCMQTLRAVEKSVSGE